MKRYLTVTVGLLLSMRVSEASAQEATPALDLQGYAQDIIRCGNEDVWDICKRCVNDAWNVAQVPWTDFCEFLAKRGFSADAQSACTAEQSQTRAHKCKWCLTIEPSKKSQPHKR
jgi:hypothetical protein